MLKPEDVKIIYDEKGHKKAVEISWRKYKRFIQDLEDIEYRLSIQNEPTVPIEELIKEFENAGQLSS